MADMTAASLIASVTSAEFDRLNPHVRDADRVELARFMAEREGLPPDEVERLEEWARDLLARPSVRLTLSEAEWDRLRRRVRETFDGDRGPALGFTAEDRDLLQRLGIEVQQSSAENEAATDAMLEEGGVPLSYPSELIEARMGRILDEAEQRAASRRRDCRKEMEAVELKIRDLLSTHGFSEEDPVISEAIARCREARESVQAALETFDRVDLRARGIDTELLRRRMEENATRAREREQRRSEQRKERKKDPLLERMRARRRAGKHGDVLPAEARAAMERPPATNEDHARLRAIDAAARRLVPILEPEESRSPAPGLGPALLALERAVLDLYNPLDPLSGAYVELTEAQRLAFKEILSLVYRRDVPITTADPWTLRLLLRWITDQAVCFRCRRLGWACECIHGHGLGVETGTMGSSG